MFYCRSKRRKKEKGKKEEKMEEIEQERKLIDQYDNDDAYDAAEDPSGCSDILAVTVMESPDRSPADPNTVNGSSGGDFQPSYYRSVIASRLPVQTGALIPV